MIKFFYFFRWIINPILNIKFLNNRKFIKFIKHIYSYIFTKKGIKNVSNYIIEIDEKIRDVLIEYNGYLGCGNCLFLARNQNDFGHNDIDYCVQNINNDNVAEFILKLENLGFKLISKLFYEEKIIELKFGYKKTYFDVFLLEKINDNEVMSYTILMNDHFPKLSKINNQIALINCSVIMQKWPFVRNNITKSMFNHEFIIPENYVQYLEYQYGYDWMIPRKEFDFLNEPKNNKPIVCNDKGIILYNI